MKNLTTLIPFLNLYPGWAQIIVVICIIIAMCILIFIPRSPAPVDKMKISVEHTINKKFEVKISLTNFAKTEQVWSPGQSLCAVSLNIMNIGDTSFTANDFFITISKDKDGTKSVHRAFGETGNRLEPIVVDPGKSIVVKAYFDVRGAPFAVPDTEGKKLALYCDIVVEAIARDGLRENLVFQGNTLVTLVEKEGENYIHKVVCASAAYRTSAITFLGNHAKP